MAPVTLASLPSSCPVSRSSSSSHPRVPVPKQSSKTVPAARPTTASEQHPPWGQPSPEAVRAGQAQRAGVAWSRGPQDLGQGSRVQALELAPAQVQTPAWSLAFCMASGMLPQSSVCPCKLQMTVTGAASQVPGAVAGVWCVCPRNIRAAMITVQSPTELGSKPTCPSLPVFKALRKQNQ